MALEDMTQGGQMVNGIYVYQTDVITSAVPANNPNRVPVKIDWSHEQLANHFEHYEGTSNQPQKQLVTFTNKRLLGYFIKTGKYANKRVYAATDSCYIFREPPVVKKEYPPWEPQEIGSGTIFKPISPEDHLFQGEEHNDSLWSGSNNLLRNHYVGEDTGSWNYKIDVYDDPTNEVCAKKAYSIVFGDYHGRGSTTFGGDLDETLTKAMYSQYRNILLEGKEKFEISGSEVDSVFIIDVPRSRFRDAVKVGSWNLSIGGYQFVTGSGSFGDALASSSLDTVITYSGSSGLYVDEFYKERERPKYSEGPISIKQSGSESEVGLFFPTHGTFVFKADLFGSLNLDQNMNGFNAYGMYKAISGSVQEDSGNGFWGQSYEKQFVNYYFLSAKNREFNFSNNPTFVTGSFGDLGEVGERKKAYITSVGLYNLERELIAIGKISKPLPKNFSTEAIFNVKISYK